MLNIDYVQSGDVVKFLLNFTDFPNETETIGELFDPTTIIFNLLDKKHEIVLTQTLGDANRITLGKYFYVLQTNETMSENSYIIEINAIVDGVTSVKRDFIKIRYV